jgi:tRNA (guanine-N7-)-methyltransferase
VSIRVRQHVNPLSAKFQKTIEVPRWADCYANPEHPLHLDIGSARGTFLLEMAQLYPDWNFLGTEIREPLVLEANDRRDSLGLQNLQYLFCNINQNAELLLTSLPPGVLQYVTIQFPDPWFKKRHQKRRVVQSDLVHQLAQVMPSPSVLFLQSDVEEVILDMIDRVEIQGSFQRVNDTWLPENPLPVPTERERATLKRNEPVYRTLFHRFQPPPGTKKPERSCLDKV